MVFNTKVYHYKVLRASSVKIHKVIKARASMVAPWGRAHLPVQEKWVLSLVQEDPACYGAAKPVHHNY